MSELSTAVSDSIQEIDEQIGELKECRDLISEYSREDLTETTYHKLCRTNMKYFDELGQGIAEVLEIDYLERDDDFFYFALPNGWKLRIPNTEKYGVDIVVNEYFQNDAVNDFEYKIHQKAIDDIQKKLDEMDEKFFYATLQQKAEYIRDNVDGTSFFPIYALQNILRNYDEKMLNTRKMLIRQQKEIQKRMTKRKELVDKSFSQQEQDIKEYIKILFKWTEEVRVYEVSDKKTVKARFKKEK